MVIDYNFFRKRPSNTQLLNHTVTMVEQIPGYIVTSDVSQLVASQGYVGGFNIAFDPFIAQISGTTAAQAQFGDWFSFDKCPRAKIFRRDAPHVTDLASMKKLMRSCDFKHDAYSTQLDTCSFLNITNCAPSYTAENWFAVWIYSRTANKGC